MHMWILSISCSSHCPSAEADVLSLGSLSVSERFVLSLWAVIQVACHRGPWCLLVAHSNFPLPPGYDCFGVGGQQAMEMQVRVPWKNREDMIIYVEEAYMVE